MSAAKPPLDAPVLVASRFAWLGTARAHPAAAALLVIIVGLVMAYAVGSSNPTMAMLPEDLSRLDRIQVAVDQLEAEDRALLLAFVKRELAQGVAQRSPNARPSTIDGAIAEQRRLQQAAPAAR
jgi:hypothetical protein